MKKLLTLLCAIPAAWGCGKSDSEKFADDYCGEVAKCCAKASLPGDGKMCHQWMTFAAAGGSFKKSAADACLANMRAQVSAGIFCDELGSEAACDGVFGSGGGNKKPGETCDFSDECAPSSEGKVDCASVYVNSAFIYKCQVQVPGNAGDSPCVGTKNGNVTIYETDGTDVLPKGYLCDMDDGLRCAAGACTALPKIGETCSYSTDCVRDGYCDYATDKCVARVAAGSACTGKSSDECVAGYYCDQQCKAKLANGTTCTDNDACQSGTCANGTCSGSGNFGLSMLCGGS